MRIFDIIFGKMIDRHIEEYQNDLIAKHCEEVRNMYKKMRAWRHDYHNHIQMLLGICTDEKKTREYLLTLNDDLMNVDTVIKTGNIMVDAILNSKISLMNEKSIPVNVKAVVPENLKISDIDLCVIVGNLLDNAIEACEKQVREQSFIRMYIGVLKGQLYISVSNSVGDKIIKRGKTYVSTKGLEGHGFGIARTDSIVSKYSGYINRQNEDGIFATEVMIPL